MSIIQAISVSGSGGRIKPKRREPDWARPFGWLGVLTRQPAFWAVLTVAMAAGNDRYRRAAARATFCYGLGAVAGNLPKALFKRPQPRFKRSKRPEIVRGSFPSGHGAAEVAYVFGAALEAPVLFVPLGTAALLAHWSLVRAGKHYLSDVLVGGTMGLAIALASKRTRLMAWESVSEANPEDL